MNEDLELDAAIVDAERAAALTAMAEAAIAALDEARATADAAAEAALARQCADLEREADL